MNDRDLDLAKANQQIDWILQHPDTSLWLKTTLKQARRRDPLAVSNDLELLSCVLRPWCETSMLGTTDQAVTATDER